MEDDPVSALAFGVATMATSYQILNIASGVDLHYIMQLQRGKNDSSDGEKVSSSDVDGARRACRS